MIRPMKWLTVALVTFALAPAAHARAGWDAQIRDLDAQFRQAMIRGDAAQLDRIVANDATIIHGGNGSIQSKSGLIDRFRSYRIETYERKPLLSKIDGNLAVLVSLTRKIAGGRQTDTSTTEVFIRRAGRWQLLVLQNTDHTDG